MAKIIIRKKPEAPRAPHVRVPHSEAPVPRAPHSKILAPKPRMEAEAPTFVQRDAHLFRKYGNAHAEEKTVQPNVGNAFRYAELGNHIIAHHELRNAFEGGKLHPETFHNLAVEIFEKEHGKEAAPDLLHAANAAYEGRFPEAQRHLERLLNENKITSEQHEQLFNNIQRVDFEGAKYHSSKKDYVTPERAEAIIRANIEKLYSLKDASSEEMRQVKQMLHEEYMDGTGELYDFVAGEPERPRDRQGAGFSHALFGTENAVLEREVARILKKIRQG